MTPTPQRAEPISPVRQEPEPRELTSADVLHEPSSEHPWLQEAAEVESPVADHGRGGRQVLGITLGVLATLWVAYCGWSAGRTLAGQPISSPQLAQWLAIAAAPLALLALAWLMFGRTRRKEAEQFTRSVITMRTEAQSLEALLEVLSQRISDSRTELTMISQHLMQLGDEATGKLGGITREFDASTEKLRQHGEVLDRAAESARNDVAVLLQDLPVAEQTTRRIAEQLQSVGAESADKAASFGRSVDELAERTRQADQLIADATDRLAARLAEIETAGSTAATRVGEANAGLSGALDTVLEKTSV